MGKELRRSAVTKILLVLALVYVFVRWFDVSSLDLYWRVGRNSSRNASNGIEIGMEESPSFPLKRLVRGRDRLELETTGISCVSDPLTDVCVVKEKVKIDAQTTSVYLATSNHLPNQQHTVRPYARKTDSVCMDQVTQVTLLTSTDTSYLSCQVNHTVPAIVFSTGGFSTNLFHDINDIIIPLYLTSRHFQSQLKFVVTDFKPNWVFKYRQILTHLSAYDLIDSSKDGRVHCFPAAVVGLKYHGDLTCNASDVPSGYSIFDFRHFLHDSFSLKTSSRTGALIEAQKPVLILISRTNSRMILNEDELIKMAKELGFQVTVSSPQRASNLERFSQEVHSCDVLVGAHGAGIANMLFLSEGAVVVQVVPVGLDWPSTTYYGDPARGLGINYLEYKITPNESSLSEKYPPNHPVFVDPYSIHLQGYKVSRAVYIDGQNIRLDLLRFRETLLQAMDFIIRK
ncbi:hypothetical protein AAC387_Pa12g2304 [Persea americana]